MRVKNYCFTLDPRGDLSPLHNLRASIKQGNKVLSTEKLRVSVKGRWGKNNPHYKNRSSDYFCPLSLADRWDVYIYRNWGG